MKIKYIGLVFLLFLGYINVSGQELLINEVDADAIQTFNPEANLTEGEALVIIKSICPFTFSSNVDKIENIVILKTEQQDGFHYYALKLKAPQRSRRLRLISDEYEAVTYSINLQPKEIRRLNVTDPFADSPFRKLLKEGVTLFEQGKYEQAKTKLLEASNVAIDTKEREETTILVEKTTLCILAKEKAEQYYSNEQWCTAIAEYEKILGANQLDNYCKEKHKTAHEKCMNSDRVISGTVTNLQGMPIGGVSIAIELAETNKKGKIKYSFSPKVTETNADGKFQVKALMKTRKLQYWLFKFKKYEIGITGDIINIIINDGSDEGPFGSSKE